MIFFSSAGLIRLDRIIKRVALDRNTTRASNHFVELRFRQLIVISIGEIRLHQRTSFVDRPVEIISAKTQPYLGQLLTEQAPISFYVRDVVEHPARNGYRLENVNTTLSRKIW